MPVLPDRNVVQNVVGLRQEMGLECHLWLLRTGVNEGVDLGWGEAFGGPVLVHLVEQVLLVSVISLAK